MPKQVRHDAPPPGTIAKLKVKTASLFCPVNPVKKLVDLRCCFYTLCLLSCAGLLLGCRVNSSPTTLEPAFYRILHAPQPELVNKKLYVIDTGDSLEVFLPTTNERRRLPRSAYQNWALYSREIDVDVFTLPFKIRPARTTLPAQLNSNFNAAMYLGRRIDSYRYRWESISPTYQVRTLRSRGFGYGLFAGIGSATINDFVVRQPIGIEYEGVIVDAGIAAIYDARIFNVGLALGFDYLTDSNRQTWIYQQKPWFGVLFGLNLN